MTLESLLFVLLIAFTLFSNGVQAYIHFEAYPLFAKVGKTEFAAYISEYENRLTLPLLLPYGLMVLCNLALIFVRPASVSIIIVILLLVINIAVSVVTLRVATPVYNQIKQAGYAEPSLMAQLMQINLLRLGLSTLSSVIVLGSILLV